MRLDELLVVRGLAPTRSRARDAIRRGHVAVAGLATVQPGKAVARDADIAVADPALAWVSRGALKLAAALDAFGLDPAGRVALDLGASTGGFTQVLLSRGAARVHAVDVGHGQLAAALAADPRVVLHEGVNARDLTAAMVGEAPDAIVADLSFISLRLALPPALALAAAGVWLVALVKPQFELGPDHLGKGGLVRDRETAQRCAAALGEWLFDLGWQPRGVIASPIAGGSGNREFLLGATYG